MVFYRTYRPQKIEDLDNENVRSSLYSIFSKGSYPHAYLFTGPKGLGKTSAARIVAKVINCEKHGKNSKLKIQNPKDIEPDNKCSQCLSITAGNNMDVLEIDGASNRGIDEIRDLRDKIRLAPFKAEKKVYIIDEVHMLTTEAFNALLKTLEEPPAHAVFILCTTEPQKVPETIASRCFRVNFSRATNEELVRSISRIVKKEEIKIDKDGLLEIAKLSDGSFRDGAKILEEISTFAGRKTITKDLVNEKYNTLGIGENVSKMLEILSVKDVKKGLSLCRELANQGMDFKFFIENLIQRLHAELLTKVGIEKQASSLNFETHEIKKLFELLSDAHQETKFAVLPQMPLEIVVLEWANDKEALSLPHAENDAKQAISTPKASSVLLSVNRQTNSGEISKDSGSISSSLSGGQNLSFFDRFINEVKNHNHLLAGVLRGCVAGEIKNDKLEIMANSKFHKEKLEEVRNLGLLEEIADKISGKRIKISIVLKGGDN
jgi:DNA polymerase-3 subunit gamma/tau